MKGKNNVKFFVILGVLGVSLSSILVKFSTAPSMILAFYRMGISTLLLCPVVWANERNTLRLLKIKAVIPCMVSGIFLAFHFTLYFESVKFTSIASSTVLVDIEVFFVVIIAAYLYKEKLSKQGIIGILITFTGSVIVALGDKSSGSNMIYGDMLAILGAMAMSVYTLIGKGQRKHLSTIMYTFIVYFSATVTLVVVALITNTKMFGYSKENLWIGLGLAVFCTLLGHSVFSWGLRYVKAAFISTVKLLEPVFATILAFFLFGQIPNWFEVIGGTVIISGLCLLGRNRE